MALTFDTGKHARAIRAGGVPAPAADAIVDAIADATSSFVTEEFLRAEMARQTAHLDAKIDVSIERLRAEMWRAMYMQIGAVTAIVTAIAGIALVLARWVV